MWLSLALLPTVASANEDADRNTARELFFQGVDATDAGDHKKAADLFDRSNRLYPAPTAALGLARALVKTGRWVRALETYYTLAHRKPVDGDPPAFATAARKAKEEHAVLEARVPGLVLHVAGPDEPVVRIDGAEVSTAALGIKRLMDPGEHVVEVSAAGYASRRVTVNTPEGAVEELHVELEPLPAPPVPVPIAVAPTPSPVPPAASAPISPDDTRGEGLRTAGYVVAGVGLLGFIGVAVTGAMYLDAESTVASDCTPESQGFVCSQRGFDAAERGRQLETVNTASWIVGGAGVGLGAGLLIAGYMLAGEVGGEHDSVSMLVSPTGAGLKVRF